MQITQESKTSIAINCLRRGGGMESYTFDLVRDLCARDAEIIVCAAQTDPAIPEYNQVETHRIDRQIIPKKLCPCFFTHQPVRARRGRNVPLVAYNPSNHADIFVCDGTYLGYLHDMDEQPGLLDRLTIRCNHSNYATTRSIMAYSHLVRRGLIALYGVPPEKICVIHPPVDTAHFRLAPDETVAVRAKYGFRDDEIVFLSPLTGHKRKGSDLLADFFGYIDLPVKLAVAGSPLPCPMKNVAELGFCTNMPELHRVVDFTVMVSLYEPFGLVDVESVLCGMHVVLPDNMAHTEIVNDEAGFFFSRSCPETLAQAVAQAVALKQQGRHKIANPMQVSIYSLALEHHVDQAVAMLEAV